MLARFLALALIATTLLSTRVHAHFTVWTVYVNGVSQGGPAKKDYVRGPPYESNIPVMNVSSSYIACHTQNRVLPRWIDVKAGDSLAFEWVWHAPGDFEAHKGPLLVDIAPADVDVNAPNAWTKLFQESYLDGSWPDEKFEGGGSRPHHEIIVPDVPAGKYLVRTELVGLQQAANAVGWSQHYPACTQINVTSDGKARLPGGTSLPGSWEPEKLVWNVYDAQVDQGAFPMPEPGVWEGSPGGRVYRLDEESKV